MQLINVINHLPVENTYVLIHLTKNNWHDRDDLLNNRYWKVAKFIRGISVKERAALEDHDIRKRTYRAEDEDGNNQVPYAWDEFGPATIFGQEVDYWCELPQLP